MAARIFTRAVGGCLPGEVKDLEWSSFVASLERHHGITEPLDSYSLPVEEAAERYVASLQQNKPRVSMRARSDEVFEPAARSEAVLRKE